VTTKREQLSVLRRVFDPEMAKYAALAFPDRERETEAERLVRERVETERAERHRAMVDTRDAVLGGVYGKPAKDKAREYAICHGRDSAQTLEYCCRLADRVRKSAHYKTIASERKNIP
jgi:hypothetical protein